MKVLLNLDIILDILQKRPHHYPVSSAVLSKMLTREIVGVLPGHILPVIFYSVRQFSDERNTHDVIDWFLANMEIAPLDHFALIRARNLDMEDFEAALIAGAAEAYGCDAIVTRRVSDFKRAPVDVLTPEELLALLNQKPGKTQP
ncbi:MAG: pilus assembly protein [Calditrichaeota bacterium]|nr:MAG: pilus assembly protein [Calditrichota bacterium]